MGEPVEHRPVPGRRGASAGKSLRAIVLPLLLAGIMLPLPAPWQAQGQDVEERPLELVPPPSRNVTPPGILPGPKIDGPLYREAVPPPPPEPPRWRRFFLPRTADSATFITKQDLVITLYGVEPLDVALTCARASGEVWPCGKTALFSLRRFLRGRAIECYLPALDGIDRAVAPCRIGRIDIAHWLIRQGWALPHKETGDDYRDAAGDARCDRLGMWRGAVADPDCPPPPPESETLTN